MDAELESLAIKLYDSGKLGDQLQRQEGRALLDRYESRDVMLRDGTLVQLQKPVFRFEGVDGSQLHPSIRVSRQMPGMGLLEAIPEGAILARADAQDCDGDGISGRAQLVADPAQREQLRLGRFGWKAEKISVAHQVADALRRGVVRRHRLRALPRP
ncbi:MAG TPA: di-heme oxidoredictase family protein [Polyangiales bacterium]|nr:di-heme oxidoredictase family protein [Polyangiales bacterium]